jgi:predicted nucleotidyltransferase
MTKFADLPERELIVDALQKWANKYPVISRVLIYGSRARGEQQSDSDIDIALELKSNREDEKPFVIWMHEASIWREELQPLFPWRLHLEWHDVDGSTPHVAEKIGKGYYLAVDKTSALYGIRLKRIVLFLYGVLILLATPIMIKALLASSEWYEKLVWSLALLFGIPTAILCLMTAKIGSAAEVKQARKDLLRLNGADQQVNPADAIDPRL